MPRIMPLKRLSVFARASSMSARMRRIAASRPEKIASPTRKCPMLSSRISLSAATGPYGLVTQTVSRMDFQAQRSTIFRSPANAIELAVPFIRICAGGSFRNKHLCAIR